MTLLAARIASVLAAVVIAAGALGLAADRVPVASEAAPPSISVR